MTSLSQMVAWPSTMLQAPRVRLQGPHKLPTERVSLSLCSLSPGGAAPQHQAGSTGWLLTSWHSSSASLGCRCCSPLAQELHAGGCHPPGMDCTHVQGQGWLEGRLGPFLFSTSCWISQGKAWMLSWTQGRQNLLL